MKNIIWYNLNEKGSIREGDDKYLSQDPGVYVYSLKLDKNKNIYRFSYKYCGI